MAFLRSPRRTVINCFPLVSFSGLLPLSNHFLLRNGTRNIYYLIEQAKRQQKITGRKVLHSDSLDRMKRVVDDTVEMFGLKRENDPVPLKCGQCGQPALDDMEPYYTPKGEYVLWEIRIAMLLRTCQCPPKPDFRIRHPLVVTPVAPPTEFPRLHRRSVFESFRYHHTPPGEWPWCSVCQLAFRCHRSLERHLQSAKHQKRLDNPTLLNLTKGKGYAYCSLCQCKIRDLNKHEQSKKHITQVEYRNKIPAPRRGKTNVYKCETCNLDFTKERKLIQHMKQTAHRRAIKWKESDSKFKCDICQLAFKSSQYLGIHLESPIHMRALEESDQRAAKGGIGDVKPSPAPQGRPVARPTIDLHTTKKGRESRVQD